MNAQIGTVVGLRIYPFKSARGIDVNSIALTRFGGRFDRHWMLVDRDDVLLSQREAPQMAQIATCLQANGLVVAAPKMEPLLLPFEPECCDDFLAKLHDDTVSVCELREFHSQWFTQFLGRFARVVVRSPVYARTIEAAFDPANEPVGLADGYPLHLTAEPSLADLNSRLSEPVPMKNFRPNIVVSGFPAYDEDCWSEIRIGDKSYRVPKLCGRCPIPSTDQETGERSKEPNRTLIAFRTVQEGPQKGKFVFGQNLIHSLKSGVIRVDDRVEVIQRRDAPVLGGPIRKSD